LRLLQARTKNIDWILEVGVSRFAVVFALPEYIFALVGVVTIGVRKIKKGCHAEALEACALGIADYALAVMHGVKAFAHMVREPHHDTLLNICGRKFIFRTPLVTTPAKARDAKSPSLTMEKPYTGNAVINDIFNGAEIIIPVKKTSTPLLTSFFHLSFAVAISFWVLKFHPLAGEVHADGWTMFFIGIAVCSMPYSVYVLMWTLAGKDIITVADGVLTIEKKNAIAKTKSYALNEASNFRAVEEEIVSGRGGYATADAFNVTNHGTIKFDYGVDTIQFGEWISEAEANSILEQLRAKKLIG
jgi:hypothetical protein